jgi:hypothetical protein
LGQPQGFWVGHDRRLAWGLSNLIAIILIIEPCHQQTPFVRHRQAEGKEHTYGVSAHTRRRCRQKRRQDLTTVIFCQAHSDDRHGENGKNNRSGHFQRKITKMLKNKKQNALLAIKKKRSNTFFQS